MRFWKKAVGYGFGLWLIPFITGFLFVDSSGAFRISETFFKTIMIVESSVVGVILALKYFKEVESNYVKEGVMLGLVWLGINWGLDLVMVFGGFFKMSVSQYFADVGLRYLSALVYTAGLGVALERKK